MTLTASALAAGSSAAPAATHSAARAATVKTATSPLGRITVDGRGRTLYLFEKDGRGHSDRSLRDLLAAAARTGQADGRPRSQASAARRHGRANGTKQVTYAGHPLYRFVQDTKPGQTNGQDSHAFGAGWYVLLTRRQEDRERRPVEEPAAHVFGPILAISGSLRRDSITSAVLRAAAAAARDGIAARIDDSPRALPHFDPDLEPFRPRRCSASDGWARTLPGCWLAGQEYALSGCKRTDGVRTTHSASKDRGVATVRTKPRGPHDVVSLIACLRKGLGERE